MKDSSFSLQDGRDLYIRIPEDIEELSIMKLSLPHGSAGKTIKITVVENDEAPFERDAVWSKNDSSDLSFYGDNEYWKSEKCTREVVLGHPECSFSDCCTKECNDVSCQIHQGYQDTQMLKLEYWRSDKVK